MKLKSSPKKTLKNRRNKYPKIILVTIFLLLLIFLILLSRMSNNEQVDIRSRAQQNGFHLTEELYGSNVNCGLNFNVHVKFNFDGCDGDVTLYKDGKLIGGPNAWNSFGGTAPFDYNELYNTASPVFIPNDGQTHSISYRGAVNRCPRSSTTVWQEISCTVTYDGSGLPQISPGDICNIKNPGEFQPAEYCAPKFIVPTDTPPPQPTFNSPIDTPTVENPSSPPPTSTNTPPLRNTVPSLTPTNTPPTPTTTIVIPFMGVKLGRLSISQPFNLFWDFIKSLF